MTLRQALALGGHVLAGGATLRIPLADFRQLAPNGPRQAIAHNVLLRVQ